MPTIKFIDRPRELKFTLSALRAFKAAQGEHLWKLRFQTDDDQIAKLLNPEIMTRVVWAGLLHGEKKLTERAAEELLEKFIEANHEDGLKAVYKAINEAFEESGLFGLKTGNADDADGTDGYNKNEGVQDGGSNVPNS